MWKNSQYLGSCNNRFGTMDETMAVDMAGDLDFETVRSKRRKRNLTEENENQDIFLHSSAENKLNMIYNELQEIRVSQETTNKGMKTFQNCFVSMNEKLGQVVDVTNTNTSVLKTLAYKSIDLEARSRRNNLIFWEFVEIPNENCFAIIRGFIADRLDLDPQNMYLSRAHRLGPRKIGSRNPRRPIIVNFRDFCDTVMIMEKAHMLRNTSFSVAYDLPKEINDARKNLWQELKAVKSRQPRAKAQIVYPAKLIVDGKVIRDEFPDWNESMRCSRLSDFSHIDKNFGFDQHSTNSDMQGPERNTTIQSCWGDSVVSDTTIRSKTNSISQYVNEVAMPRDQNMGQNERSDNGTIQPQEPIEMVVFSQTSNNETRQNNEASDRSRPPSVEPRPRSLSPEKPGLFRPYDRNVGTQESISTKQTPKTQSNIPSASRSHSERRSRPVERGPLRPPSFSPATRKCTETVANKTGSTSSKNKQTTPINNSQSKQTQSDGQPNTSHGDTPTRSVSTNNLKGVNDVDST